MTSQLTAEFLLAMNSLDDQAAKCLRRHGVPETAFHLWPGPVGVANIEPHPLSCFDFAEHGRCAFIQPVLSGGAFTDLCDLVAWHPDRPDQVWQRRYTGIPLGVDQLDRAGIEGEPVAVRRTPLSWLCSGGDGVLITDWAMSAPSLRCVQHVICEDDSHALFVHDRLKTPAPTVPEIRVRVGRAA